MNFRTPGPTLATVAALCCASPDVAAQPEEYEVVLDPTPCARASRLESNIPCEHEPPPDQSLTITHEYAFTTKVEGRVIQTRQCEANALVSCVQKNTLASVEVEIENHTCAAASGKVVLNVYTLDESRERTIQEYTEQWARDDDELVTLNAEYPIGANVELSRVRIKQVSCTCAEVPQAGAGSHTLSE